MFPILLIIVVALAAVNASPVQRRKVGVLPDSSTFQTDNNTKWTIEYVGDIKFTGQLGSKGLAGDKCRSSELGGRHIWNCGDMECAGDPYTCGFSMGASFYGTSNVRKIDSSAYAGIEQYTFAQAWSGDPKPKSPQSTYGMDTSNVAAINKTTGIAYAWEITRGGSGVPYVSQGAAVVAVTLGKNQPIATRLGPLLTGPDSVSLGLLGILEAGGYIYNYNQQGPFGNIMVGRVSTSNNAPFHARKYEYLTLASANTNKPKWVSGIPPLAHAARYGMASGDSNGLFTCQQYGSVSWNNYFNKYMLMCNLYLDYVFFYTAENPWGPWSEGYKLLGESWIGYGVSAHPSYSPGNWQNELYFSQGSDGAFNTFKVTFHY